ncbi:MAG: 30S ribosomal protein S28e [archaeon]|nr:30S ribosomal protein S28e [archaeon]
MNVGAKVVRIIDRQGTKGICRVRCQVTDNTGRNRVIIRNVLGPVRIGDILMISEVDMESASVIE